MWGSDQRTLWFWIYRRAPKREIRVLQLISFENLTIMCKTRNRRGSNFTSIARFFYTLPTVSGAIYQIIIIKSYQVSSFIRFWIATIFIRLFLLDLTQYWRKPTNRLSISPRSIRSDHTLNTHNLKLFVISVCLCKDRKSKYTFVIMTSYAESQILHEVCFALLIIIQRNWSLN